MPCRGVRGATTVDTNTPEAVLSATKDLLEALVTANDLHPRDLASAIFTVTADLNAAYPARAARDLGWTEVALLCSQEIDVPGGLARCVRVLLHWNTERAASEVRHVYLKEAEGLRPDLGLNESFVETSSRP